MPRLPRSLAALAVATLASTSLALAAPPTAVMASAPADYLHPADACALVVDGGVEGVDYYYASETWTRNGVTSNLKKLVICSSTPMTIANAAPSQAIDATIFIEAGTQASITLDGVSISSHVPMTLERNRDAAGESMEPGTSCHVTLARGSKNTLTATAGAYAPGIRCGEGSSLTIDDDVANVDTEGSPIDATGGHIAYGTTYRDREGNLQTSREGSASANLSNLESTDPGSLDVTGGYLCAGIGGADWETTGNLTFNGGVIRARAVGDGTYGFGAGIGGSHGGHGTTADGWITFNGGVITSYASYHGAAIGGGGPSYTTAGSTSRTANYTFPDAKLSDRQPGGSFSANAGTPVSSKVVAGNLMFNGGVITPISADHGNAIGQGCFCWNVGRKIVITGGTILPDTSRQDASYGYAHAIGALGGEVYVTGGSVRIGTVTHDNGRTTNERYQAYLGDTIDPENIPGNIYTNYSTDTAYGSLDKGTRVMMRSIKVPGDLGANARIESFSMTINGVTHDYGAPATTDEYGNLYLWLPTEAEGEVRVNLKAVDATGAEVPTEPYYMNDVQNGGTYLKQYVIFSVDEGRVPTLTKLTKRYDGLAWGDDTQSQLLSEVAQTAIEVDNPPVASGSEKNKLTDASSMTMESQRLACDDDGNLIRLPNGSAGNLYAVDESAGITQGFNANVGKYKLTISSNQFATNASFAQSFYGHRCYYDYAEITPADSQTELMVERVGDTASITLTAQVSPRHDDEVTEAVTCAAPTGKVRFLINGQQVGDLVDLEVAEGDGTPTDGYARSTATVTLTPADYRSLLQNPRLADPTSPTFGRQQVTAEFVPAEKGNYTDSNATSNEEFFVAVDPEWWTYEKTYDGTPDVEDLTGSHILDFVPEGFDVSLTYDTEDIVYEEAGANVGTHGVTLRSTHLTGADVANVILVGYEDGGEVTLAVTVNPRPVTVSAAASLSSAPAGVPYTGHFSVRASLVGDDSLGDVLGRVTFSIPSLDKANPAPGFYRARPMAEALAGIEPEADGSYILGNYRFKLSDALVRIDKVAADDEPGRVKVVAQDIVAGGDVEVRETLEGDPVECSRSYLQRTETGWVPIAGVPRDPGTYMVIATPTGTQGDGATEVLPGSDVFTIVPKGTSTLPEGQPAGKPLDVSADDILVGEEPRVNAGDEEDPVEVDVTYWRQDPLDPTHWEPVDDVPREPGVYLVVAEPNDPGGPWAPGSTMIQVRAPDEPGIDEEAPDLVIGEVTVEDGVPRVRVTVDGESFDPANDPEGRTIEEIHYRVNPDGTLTRLEDPTLEPGDYRVVVRLLGRDGELLAEVSRDYTLGGGTTNEGPNGWGGLLPGTGGGTADGNIGVGDSGDGALTGGDDADGPDTQGTIRPLGEVLSRFMPATGDVAQAQSVAVTLLVMALAAGTMALALHRHR